MSSGTTTMMLMTQDTATKPNLNVDDIQLPFEVRDANEVSTYKHGTHVDVCFVCGRGMTEKGRESAWHIHLVDGGIGIAHNTNDSEDDDGEMGYFPIGSECAKKVPADYRVKL